MLLISWLFSFVRVRPNKPNDIKKSVYECGMETIGSGRWEGFNVRYYRFALLFVLFDVEVVFLFPWAVVFLTTISAVFYEMLIFIAILFFGIVYAWRKGVLQWR